MRRADRAPLRAGASSSFKQTSSDMQNSLTATTEVHGRRGNRIAPGACPKYQQCAAWMTLMAMISYSVHNRPAFRVIALHTIYTCFVYASGEFPKRKLEIYVPLLIEKERLLSEI